MNANNFEVRKVQLTADVKQGFSLMYLSDFHFNAYSQFAAQWMLEQITILQPSLLLLGGDYADTRRGLQVLDFFLAHLPPFSQCFAVAGNHDYFIGIDKVKDRMLQHRVNWVEHQSITLQIGMTSIQIDGNKKHSPPTQSTTFTVLCAHNPKVLSGSMDGYQLALAGHLHGSQIVLWQHGQALFPGKFFYSWNILSQQVDDCTCYISKGLGDTLPLRFNCKKDVIFVEVQPLEEETG